MIPAPLDHRLHGLLARGGAGARAREELETIVQAVANLLGIEHADAAGRQLDGERNAIQPSTDLGHRWRIGRVERETRLDGYGPIHEEPDRLADAQGLDGQGV